MIGRDSVGTCLNSELSFGGDLTNIAAFMDLHAGALGLIKNPPTQGLLIHLAIPELPGSQQPGAFQLGMQMPYLVRL